MSGHFVSELCTIFAERTNHAAVFDRGRSYSYGELEELVRNCAGWLHGLGVGTGDRVALCTGRKLSFLVAQLGAMWAGAIALPLNPRFTREELRYFLADGGAKLVVAEEAGRQSLEELGAAVVPDSAALVAPTSRFQAPAIAAVDPCLILYSSGTTGWPKGVVHTHANVASGLRALQACWRLTPEDRVVNVLPLFHIHGLSFATHLVLLTGGCVLLEEVFDPHRILAVVGLGTIFMGVPTIYYRLLEHPGFRTAVRSWQSVRLFTCGSAPIRPEVLPELESILGRAVINRYGMTEAFVITSQPLDGPRPHGSVGLPLAGIELRVAREDGSSAGSCEVGTVLLRGPNLFREYWQNPAATAAALATGWFDTGDLGWLDSGGFLTLVGRKNDLIITKGFNVYPQVVERILDECPGVSESAVLGVPDNRRGERVVAVIVRGDAALDEDTLRAWCRDRLVDYQRPSSFVFRDALPRNTLGKVLRRELREELAK